jgi:hypothetical protein
MMKTERDDRQRHINEFLNAKRCQAWPECACHKTLVHWQDKLLANASWEFESLAWADTSIFFTLSCVAKRCPERRARAYAQVQLLNPWWNRQRRGEELTEEYCERLRSA